MSQLISRNQIQYFSKLNQKKYRRQYGRYLISGLNSIRSALEDTECAWEYLLLREDRRSLLKHLPLQPKEEHILIVQERDFRRINREEHPQGIALVAVRPDTDFKRWRAGNTVLYLDRVNDPGNLGTIIRTACWFGINHLLLSPDCADPFNPKVVRASTGYVAKIHMAENVTRQHLSILKEKESFYLFGTAVENGEPLTHFHRQRHRKKMILLGSEAHGLEESLLKMCQEIITIPRTGFGESLNLAVSAGIIMYHFQIAEET